MTGGLWLSKQPNTRIGGKERKTVAQNKKKTLEYFLSATEEDGFKERKTSEIEITMYIKSVSGKLCFGGTK